MNKSLAGLIVVLCSLAGFWLYTARAPQDLSIRGEGLSPRRSQHATQYGYINGQAYEAMPAEPSSVDLIVRELASSAEKNVDVEERAQMARDINAAYRAFPSEAMRRKVSEALTQALHREKDAQVARAIAFAHSRLPYDEHTLPNLRTAYKRKVIDYDGYYGELAHLYSGAPEDVRKEVVKEISESHNRYAVDIIAGSLVGDENIQLSQEEVSNLHRFLKSHAPIFTGSADAFGYFEAILYSNWLISMSRLQNEAGGPSREKYLGDKLLDPTTDPRASIAFLISGYAKNMTPAQRQTLQWTAVQARAQEFIQQNADSPSLQYVRRDMHP